MRQEHKAEMKARKRNVRLLVAYDGTNYHGFQYQNPPVIAVQNVLEEVLEKIFGDKIEMAASGRTDAGVHALGQVVNFFTDGTIPLERVPMAANSLLPSDITILEAQEADRDFSARHSAQSKSYIYKILNALRPYPFLRNSAWHIKKELDIASMEKCLKMLEGKHDFSAFRATGGPDVSPVRNIFSAKLKISDREKLPYENGYWNNTDNGKIIEMRFFADGFLYHQVRNMVGTLANVGMGRTSAEKFKEIFEGLDRTKAGATAPAQGLYLEKVNY